MKKILAKLFCICSLVVSIATANAAETPTDPGWIKSRMLRQNINLKEQAEGFASQENFAQAAKIYSEMADLAKNASAGAWARVTSGDMYLAAGDIDQARRAYEAALEAYPTHINFNQVLQRLRDIANHYAASQGSLLGIPVSRVNRAIDIYELILTKAPAGVRAPYDTLRLARLKAAAGEEEEAKIRLGEVIRRFPDSDAAPLARLELATILVKQAEEQQNYFQVAKAARTQAQQFIRFYPDHEDRKTADVIIQRANEKIAEYYLSLGQFYSHPVHDNPDAAKRYFGLVVNDYPDTVAAVTARQELATLQSSPSEPDTPGRVPAAADKGADAAPVESTMVTDSTAPMTVVEPDPDSTPTYSVDELRARENVEKTLLPLEASSLPAFNSIAVGDIVNDTREPQVGTYLKHQLAEQIMMDPEVKLLTATAADIVVELRIKDITFSPAASAKIRDENDTPDDLGVYSTTIFRTYVDIDYRVLDGAGDVAVDWMPVRGEADFPETPDLNTNRQEAFKQACNDAALRIVSSITEAW